ncbi:hypothetical protein PQX77_016777 [Marasmius sp. AFHP31]|nr:hypothetical protein PQX77_016777 [Marasmius sp. AFHP31]
MNEAKLHTQISNSVKQKEPRIQNLAQEYNKLVTKMQKLIKQKKAPRNVVAPESSPTDRIFTLNVDDSIWQDVGLTNKYDHQKPLLWLADKGV